MCKLFAVSNTRLMGLARVNSLSKFVNQSFLTTQRDGFGLSIETSKGRFTERYVNPRDYIGIGCLRKELETKHPILQRYYKDRFASPEGEIGKLNGPMILHGRTSTGLVSLGNTHPFTKNDWTLAHNGVVDWTGEKRDIITSCDSEHLLNCFAIGGGGSDLDKLSGWAAWVAINPSGELQTGRDSFTPLYYSYTRKFKSYLIATKKEDIQQASKKLGLGASMPLSLPDNSMITYAKQGDGVSEEIHGGLQKVVIKHAVYNPMVAKARVALGYKSKQRYFTQDPSIESMEVNDEHVAEWEKSNWHQYNKASSQ